MLALIMTFGIASVPAYAENVVTNSEESGLADTSETTEGETPTYTDDQIQALNELVSEPRPQGLIGFEEAGIDLTSSETVNVIVEFNNLPAEVAEAVENASAEVGGEVGITATSEVIDKEQAVADDRAAFDQGLTNLFGGANNRRSASSPYSINTEYGIALSGVSMSLPANKVPELLNISSVYCVFTACFMTLL
jgi:hypothetical protein